MYLTVGVIPIVYTAALVLSVVNEYCNASVHHFLEKYEVLNYEPTRLHEHHRRTRSAVQDATPTQQIELQILAFEKNLTIVLNHDYNVIHPTARLTIAGSKNPEKLSKYADHMVHGFAANYPNSKVFGSIVNGVFRGTIVMDLSKGASDVAVLSDSYFVEPAGYYFEEITEFHSIIYHSSHVRKPDHHLHTTSTLPDPPSHFCGLSNPDIVQKMQSLSVPPSAPKQTLRRAKRDVGSQPQNIHDPSKRLKQSSEQFVVNQAQSYFGNLASLKHENSRTQRSNRHKKRVCNLLLQSDTFLWDRVMKLRHVNGDREAAVKEITSLFTQHVQSAQAIFYHHVFRDHSGQMEFSGIGFRVDHVVINMTDVDCKPRPDASAAAQEQFDRSTGGSYAEDNPFCLESIDVTNMLNLFSYNNYDAFCAAYVFTYRDFASGTLGLAWVGSLTGPGGVCSKHRLLSEGTQSVYKSLNTGLVTLVNFGRPVPSQVSQVTFAHELGHNFGSQHDNDHKDEPYGCLPPTGNPQGNYIMFSSATNGNKENNHKFSRCSSDSIARLLNRLLTDGLDCFLDSDGAFCGNKLVEDKEECDCGLSAATCSDKCCNPRDSDAPCKLMDHVMINGAPKKVYCSVTAGECCNHHCQFQAKTHMCRDATECYEAAFCNGEDAKCPQSKIRPDGTLCQEGTRVCKNGQCTGSICESIDGWRECSVIGEKDATPESLCVITCQANLTGAPCISALMLEQSQALRRKYPSLAEKLLQNGSARKMAPGTPCDNFKGYCDAFHRCVPVDVQGPLTRLRNLLFSQQTLEKVKSWVTFYWWAVILMCLGAIIAMIVFVKVCARNTPLARSRYPHRDGTIAIPAVWLAEHYGTPEVPSPPYSAPSGRPHRGPNGEVDPRTSDYDRWAWPSNKAPKTKHHKRHKGPHPRAKAPAAPPMNIEDLAPHPNARQKPLPPLRPNILPNNGGEPDQPSIELVPITLHESGGTAHQTTRNAQTSSATTSQPTEPSVSASKKPKSGADKSSRMVRASGARQSASAHRPVSMFARPPNSIPLTRVEPQRRRKRLDGSRRSNHPGRPSSSVFAADDHHPYLQQSHLLLEECVLLPSSACIPVRSSTRAAGPTRQLSSSRPEGSGAPSGGPRTAFERSSIDPGVPPPAYDDLPFQKPVIHRRRSSPPGRA